MDQSESLKVFTQALELCRQLQSDRINYGYDRVDRYFEGGSDAVNSNWLEKWQKVEDSSTT